MIRYHSTNMTTPEQPLDPPDVHTRKHLPRDVDYDDYIPKWDEENILTQDCSTNPQLSDPKE